MNKRISNPAKITLIIFTGMMLLILSFQVSSYLYCHTVAICEHPQPTLSFETKATLVNKEYEMAIQDINSGRYKSAKERLEYVIYQDHNYPEAKKKLSEIEKILEATTTP